MKNKFKCNSMIIFLATIISFLIKNNIHKSKVFKGNYLFSNGIILSLGLLATLIYLISLIDLRIVEVGKQALNVVSNFNGLRTIAYLLYELLVDSQQSFVNLGILGIDIFFPVIIFIFIFFIWTGVKNIKLLSMMIILGVSLMAFQNKLSETQNRNNRYETYKAGVGRTTSDSPERTQASSGAISTGLQKNSRAP